MLTRLHQRRIFFVTFIIAALSLASFFVLKAFNENLLFYFLPSDVKAGKAPLHRPFRMGGMVEKGSVKKQGLNVRFEVTDTRHKIAVTYSGILPDLFREGQGVIVRGQMDDEKLFTAEEVLAKHDEKYAPPGMGGK